MKHMIRAKRLLSVLLALVLALSALGQLEPPAHAAEPSFGTVLINDAEGQSLKAQLEADGNFIIKLNTDVHAWIGEPGDNRLLPIVRYWCTLGSGIKVLDLNGHDFKLSYDAETGSLGDPYDWMSMGYHLSSWESAKGHPMAMLRVVSGSELVINDAGDIGEINYDGYIDTKCLPGTPYMELRNLIEVDGGKLTVNGGKLHAGRSKKFYCAYDAEYYWAQINGAAVVLNSGQAVINGGNFHGRGYAEIKKGSAPDIRASAIKATGGNLKIYDGEFWGNGCADVLQVSSGATVSVYGGRFSTHKQSDGVCFEGQEAGEIGDAFAYHNTSYGKIGIPASAFREVRTFTEVYRSGTGYLTANQVAAGGADDVSSTIYVFPVENQGGTVYQRVGDSLVELAEGTTIEWDKLTNLRLRFTHDQYYPHNLTGIYEVYGQDYGHTHALISTSPNGKNQVARLDASSGSDNVELNNLPQSAKDALEVGRIYYLTMRDYEKWMTPTETREINYSADSKLIKLKIVPPDLSGVDIDMGLSFENSLNSSGKPQIRLVATGDASWGNLDRWKYDGTISRYELVFMYKDTSNQWKSYTTGTGSIYMPSDIYRGVSQARLTLRLYKGSTKIAEKEVYSDVVCFPDLASSPAADSYGRVLVDRAAGANHDVTLSLAQSTAGTTGLFWHKDGTKLSGSSGLRNYGVTVSSGTAGWYGVGYTIGGKDYFSEQTFYLGTKAGTWNVSISPSATVYDLKADGNAAPRLTASLSGSAATIARYKWHPVSWPEGAKPNALNVLSNPENSNTILISRIFGSAGHETSAFVEGTYKFSVTATDTWGDSVTSDLVSITVRRTPQGLELWQDYQSDSWHEPAYSSLQSKAVEVTDSFIVLHDEYSTDSFRAVFTPENASVASISLTASNDSVSVSGSGDVISITGMGGSSSVITATAETRDGTISASTTVLIPKTRYLVNFPESWLDIEAGENVHRASWVYTDYTAELTWYYSSNGSSFDYEYTEDTFKGNLYYRPLVKIYPNAGVCYPVNILFDYNRTTYYFDAVDRYVITVNGVDHYGADYCGRDYTFSEPLSAAGRYDVIWLYLDPTEKIIDWRDEYISSAVFSLEVPSPGDPKDVTPDSELSTLNLTPLTDGIILTDSVEHVTDVSTIRDRNTSNDAVEDFESYELGETYRDTVWILIDNSYTTPFGGRAFFADKVTAVEPELGAISGAKIANYVMAYVYFTVGDPESIHPSTGGGSLYGDVDLDGDVDAADLTALARHVAKISMISNAGALANADVTKDGSIDAQDLTRLARFVSKIIDTL
ncbi:MAG: hypothetical protein II173_03680 [Firmicutes bacterium]|nr:hypothetical protein [Bacillota bacterium]